MAEVGEAGLGAPALTFKSSSTESLAESSADDTRALLAHQILPNGGQSQRGEPDAGQALSRWSRFKEDPVTVFFLSWWRIIVILLFPLLFLPLPFLWKTPASRALFTILIMAVYWVTEAVPIAITSLLPLILFPALGVLPADATARNYLKDSNLLFVGGLMMAVAIEKWNLHKRMALLVLRLVGSKPKWLLFGFMSTTAFLSMWISNTATAAMMLPIAQAVLLEIKEESDLMPDSAILGERRFSVDEVVTPVRYTRHGYNSTTDGDGSPSALDEGSVTIEIGRNQSSTDSDDGIGDGEDRSSSVASVAEHNSSSSSASKRFDRLAKSLMLGVAYSANIGGTGTLTGTGPNVVLAGLAGDLGINFGLWFVFATPAMLLALLLSWLYLAAIYSDDSFQTLKQWLFKRQKYSFESGRAKAVIKEQYKRLGRIRYAEVLLVAMFVLLVLLWLFREPGFIPGWGSFFSEDENNDSFVSDATAVLAVVFLLCIIPSEPCCCSWKDFLGAGSSPRLLDWDSIQKKLPWNVIILLGSGFAIAEAAEESGLSEWIGDRLTLFENLPREVIALSVSIIVAFVTEVVSNVATATLFLPILRILGESLCIHPLYLMIPATVSASYAFMVPVATPPNAIAFSYGYIKVYNMVFTGLFMNFACVGIVTLALNTIGVPIFKLNSFPGNQTNCGNGTETELDLNLM